MLRRDTWTRKGKCHPWATTAFPTHTKTNSLLRLASFSTNSSVNNENLFFFSLHFQSRYFQSTIKFDSDGFLFISFMCNCGVKVQCTTTTIWRKKKKTQIIELKSRFFYGSSWFFFYSSIERHTGVGTIDVFFSLSLLK